MRITEAVSNQRAVVKDWGFGESKEKKTPFFWMEFRFMDISGDNNEELTIRKDWYITDRTIDYILRDLRTLGWTGRDITEWEKGQSNSFDFSDKETEISTELEEFADSEGRPRTVSKVKWIGSQKTPMLEPTAIKNLAAKMKGKIAAYNAREAQKPKGAGGLKKSDKVKEMEQAGFPT